MQAILQPGIKAPEFTLPAVNLEQEVTVGGQAAGMTVLLFFGSEVTHTISDRLGEYQERLPDFKKNNARVIAITDAAPDALQRLAQEKDITFPLVRDAEPLRGIAQSYGVVTAGAILPAVFVIDQDGLIRRVYNWESAAGLPNPAMVNRALVNLANTPKPPFVTADDWRLGSPEAPVIIIEYGDYQCGHCRDLYRTIMALMPVYKDQVQFIFRHFPLRHLHPQAWLAAEAAEAAGAQGKFWQMHARLFAAANALEREDLIAYAREIGLDVERFTTDLDSHRFEEAVKEDYRGATRNKIKSAPTLFINYILFAEPPTAEALRDRIDSLIACRA